MKTVLQEDYDPLSRWVDRRGALFGVSSWSAKAWPFSAPPAVGVLWAVLAESEYAELADLVASAERDDDRGARKQLAVCADWLQAKGVRAGEWVAAYLEGSDAYVGKMTQALDSVPSGYANLEGTSVHVVWTAYEPAVQVRFSMNRRCVEDRAVEAQLLRVLKNKLALVLSKQPRLMSHERDRFQAMAERCAYQAVDAVFGRAFLPDWQAPVELAGELRPQPVAVRRRKSGRAYVDGAGDLLAEYLLGTTVTVPKLGEPTRALAERLERVRKAAMGLPL